MGIVWQAQDERLHRTVAVKQLLLQPGLSAAESEEAKARSMREGRIAARLQHPHAIAVYDVAEDDGQPWLVMEYLPSKSLSTVLSERGTLPPHEVARIGTQVASALAAAHNAGIVHRDIKPGNVLLGDDGTVKITDFGISRATGDVTVTATGMLAGTPAYLAPEVAKGYDPGPPSDVFSLGSTLYAAVEGMPPFGLSDNTIALLHQVAAGKVPPPRQAGSLTALLMSLLRPEPADRPTMAQAREALAAAAAGRVLDATPPGGAPLPPPPQYPQPQWQPHPAAPTRALGGGPNTPGGGWPPVHNPNPAATRLDARPLDAGTPAPNRPNTPPRGVPAGQGGGGGKRSPRSMIVAAVAVIVAAVAGILLANVFTAGSSGRGGQSAGSSSAVSSPAAVSPTDSAPPSASAGSPVTTDPTPEQQVQLVQDYFGLLPKHPREAWAKLSPQFQAKVNGGFEGYQKFWQTIDKVSVSNVRQTSPYVVQADVHYTKKDGHKTVEPKLYSIRWEGPNIFLDNEQSTGNPQDE
jgi:serine/threonine protein kinase